jgi:Domain of unknown function DUF11
LSTTLTSGGISQAITCVASTGVSCPVNLGTLINFPEIAVGGSLKLSIPVAFAAGINGNQTSTFATSLAGDVISANNRVDRTDLVYSNNVSISLVNLSATESNTKLGVVTSVGTLGYSVLVANSGPGIASDIVVKNTLGAGFVPITAKSCAASGGASCPVLNTNDVSIPNLPVGGSLEFIYHAQTAISTRGQVNVGLTASALGDSALSNNSATAQVTLDTRNDEYLAFGLDGMTYSLKVNFNSGVFTFGNAAPTIGNLNETIPSNFIRPPLVDATYPFAITTYEGIRYKDDVIVGSFTYAGARKSFIAARSFVSTPADLVGDLNIVGIQRSNVSGPTSLITSGRWQSGGTAFQLCLDNVITLLSSCPLASQRNYSVTFNGADINLYDAVRNETNVVRVAKIKYCRRWARCTISYWNR